MNKPYYQYAVDVVEDKLVCCDNIKLACKRFLFDLKRKDLEFREDVVDEAISFIGILKHFAGKSSGQLVILWDFIGRELMTDVLQVLIQK